MGQGGGGGETYQCIWREWQDVCAGCCRLVIHWFREESVKEEGRVRGDLPVHLKGMTRCVCSVTVSVTSVSQREGQARGWLTNASEGSDTMCVQSVTVTVLVKEKGRARGWLTNTNASEGSDTMCVQGVAIQGGPARDGDQVGCLYHIGDVVIGVHLQDNTKKIRPSFITLWLVALPFGDSTKTQTS